MSVLSCAALDLVRNPTSQHEAQNCGIPPSKKGRAGSETEERHQLRDAIKIFLEAYSIDRTVCYPMPLYSDRIEPEMVSARAENCRALEQTLRSSLQLLQAHADHIRAGCDGITVHGNAANPWKAGFAAELGFSWRSLTGKDPSLSPGDYNFLSFLVAAFVSIGGDPNEKWDRPVREILHRRTKPAEGDGFDRYEHDSFPPGTHFIDTQEWEERSSRRQQQALEEQQELVRWLERSKTVAPSGRPRHR